MEFTNYGYFEKGVEVSDGYYRIRFLNDKNRGAVWREIVRYLKKFIPKEGAVLDLGAGYCDFINQVGAQDRYALDVNENLSKYTAAGVKPLVGKTEEVLEQFANNSVGLVFSSNFLEHLNWPEIERVAFQVRRILPEGGCWIIIQPNFKYAYRGYFDDYTHRTIFTETSLSDYLASKGFILEQKFARFLPFSFHTRLPKLAFLVRIYLRLPFKPWGRQMLIIVRKKKNVA